MKQFILTVSLSIFLITFSVIFTLNFRPLYYSDINLLHISRESGFSEQRIRENYDRLIDYNSVFYKKDLKFPSLPMSKEGKIHFQDVKRIFSGLQYACLVSFIIILAGLLWKREKKYFRFLKKASVIAALLPLIFGVLIWAAGWDRAFVAFHELAFSNDYWIFDEAFDPVITILPDAFFLHCALLMAAVLILLCAACFLTGRHLCNKQKF